MIMEKGILWQVRLVIMSAVTVLVMPSMMWIVWRAAYNQSVIAIIAIIPLRADVFEFVIL
jgi:hypothetical protein